MRLRIDEIRHGKRRGAPLPVTLIPEKNMGRIKIGKIVNASGLKGEVRVYNYSGSRERYNELKSIFVEDVEHDIEKVRYVRDLVVLKLSGIDSRDAADGARGGDVYIDEKDLPDLPEGAYYIRDMIGITVDDERGNTIGTLSDVIQGRAQDLYEVDMADGRKALIPAVEEFITGVDIEKRHMTVKLIEGLI